MGIIDNCQLNPDRQ